MRLLALALSLLPLSAPSAPLLVLTDQASLASHPAPAWGQTRVTGAVVLLNAIPGTAGNWPYQAAPAGALEAAVAEVKAKTSGVELYLAFRADRGDPVAPTLFPWGNGRWESELLPELTRFSGACAANDVSGVLDDGEIYTGTPGDDGGLPNNAVAWLPGMRAEARAADYARACRSHSPSLTLGSYEQVWAYRKLKGWLAFNLALSSYGNTVLLDEGGYVGHPSGYDFNGRAVSYRGRVATRKLLRRVPGRPTWLWDRDGVLFGG